jgi:hypothetical protein
MKGFVARDIPQRFDRKIHSALPDLLSMLRHANQAVQHNSTKS